MNLAALRVAVENEGYPANATVLNDAINAAYREVCSSERWKFLEKQDKTLVTVAGTPNYALPMSDWRNVDAVRIEQAALQTYPVLDYVNEQDFRDYYHSDRNQSVPCVWTLEFGQIWFYPIPDGVYSVTIDYIFEPPDLSADGDVPVIPSPYHDILRWGAVLSMAYRQRDWLGRQFADQKKSDLFAKMKGEYQVKQRQTSSHVSKSGAWGTPVSWPAIYGGNQ